jgi:hypothetical protein
MPYVTSSPSDKPRGMAEFKSDTGLSKWQTHCTNMFPDNIRRIMNNLQI